MADPKKKKNKKKEDRKEVEVKKRFSLNSIAFWKRPTRRHEPDLNKVWLYSLGVFGIVAIAVIIFHIVLYLRISRDEIFTGGDREVPAVETIDRAELNEVLSFFEERATRFRNLEVSRPSTVDPAF